MGITAHCPNVLNALLKQSSLIRNTRSPQITYAEAKIDAAGERNRSKEIALRENNKPDNFRCGRMKTAMLHEIVVDYRIKP